MPRYRFVERLYTLAVRPAGRWPAGPPAAGRRAAGEPAGQRPAVQPNLFPAYEPQGEIIETPAGTAALLDQRAYKQTVIDGYAPVLSLLRPFLRLPKPNTTLNHAYVTHFNAKDPHALIATILEQGKRYDRILFGFTESDPHLAAARRFKPVEYTSSIYTVAFDDGDDFHERLLARPRALDISAL
jgi:hypothetical protein